jgi:orotate phosphoribosyltransferase-like protein
MTTACAGLSKKRADGTELEVAPGGGTMVKQFLMSSVIAGVMAFGIPTATAFAQQTTAEQDAKKAKEESKKAGQQAGEASKDAAKATGKGVKKGAKKTAKTTKKAATKTKDAVTLDTTSAVCKDGTTQTGKTKTTACNNHGGVAGK